jgi:glucose/arabinose dehydrogenase
MWETSPMKSLIMVPLLAAALAVHAQGLKVPAQKPGAQTTKPAGRPDWAKPEASKTENEAVVEIVKCMLAGLPEDWNVAIMDVNLEKPFEETGSVSYLVARGGETRPTEAFMPCDEKTPARTLISVRNTLPRDRQGWIGARLTVTRDLKFGIRYGYPN